MNKKIKKNLYLPEWMCEFLDAEGKIYEGPGTVAAAAIFHFNSLNKKDKIKAVQDYKIAEVARSYSD